MSPRLSFGLRARFVVAVSSTLVALLVSVAYFALSRSALALEEVDRARFQASVDQLAYAISYAVLAESRALLAPTIDAFARHPELVEVEVLASEGSSSLAKRSGGASRGEIVRVEAVVSTRGEIPGDADDELAVFGIDERPRRAIGRVVADFSRDGTLAVGARRRRDVIAIFAGLGVAAIGGVCRAAPRIRRRVRGLADDARSG